MAKQGVNYADSKAPPGMRLYAIGDVHGHRDLLQKLHDRIFREIERDRPDDWRLIHLGDYVDRGPDSKGVIDLILAATEKDARVLALAGNHDVKFDEFLEEPDVKGLFALYGGLETAKSYGVSMDFSSFEAALPGYWQLLDAVPETHRRFLKGLKRSVAFGDFFFCHAGIRPHVPLDQQDAEDLIWIRRDFHDHPGLYDKVVVHGHTPSRQVEVLPNRVNLDTGVFMHGILSAIAIDGRNKNFMQVSEGE